MKESPVGIKNDTNANNNRINIENRSSLYYLYYSFYTYLYVTDITHIHCLRLPIHSMHFRCYAAIVYDNVPQ